MVSSRCKWVAEYNTEIFDPDYGDYIYEKRKGFFIFDINLQYKVYKSISIGLGSKNIGNYTNKIHGPFNGTNNYIEIKLINERNIIK